MIVIEKAAAFAKDISGAQKDGTAYLAGRRVPVDEEAVGYFTWLSEAVSCDGLLQLQSSALLSSSCSAF